MSEEKIFMSDPSTTQVKTGTEVRLEFLETKINYLLEQLAKIDEELKTRQKESNYSEDRVKKVVESILQNKIVVLIEGAVWLKVGDKYVAHNSTLFDERTGLPRTGEGATVFLALCDLANRYIVDEFGLPKPENTEV